MPKHEYFEELAAIGALGELDDLRRRELNLHLAACTDCKRISDEYEALHAMRPALGADTIALIESRREAVRTAFLEKIAREAAPAFIAGERRFESVAPTSRWTSWRFACSGLGAVAALGFVFWLGTRYETRALAGSERALHANPTPPTQSGATSVASTSTVQPQAVSQGTEVSKLVQELRAERRRSVDIQTALATRDRNLEESRHELVALQQQLDAETEELHQTQSLLAAKADQLTKLQAAKAADADALVALRYQVQDLTEKLREQKDNLDRERQLLASGRDIRDIIGARNLHIIDVYDTDPYGNTKKSFARAFYTEGKSLIFYAYDLPPHRTEEGRYAYTAWGQHNGNKDNVRNLGILLNDDKGQKRWVLNFSDPKVLAEIDSVFITLERVGFEGNRPSGKRILTAYLQSQINHP